MIAMVMLARPPTYPDPHPARAEVAARMTRPMRWRERVLSWAAVAIYVAACAAIWVVAGAVLVGVLRWVPGR